jgi:hypothetical protein
MRHRDAILVALILAVQGLAPLVPDVAAWTAGAALEAGMQVQAAVGEVLAEMKAGIRGGI